MRGLSIDECPFCLLPRRECVLESELSFAIFDAFPVGPGHLLILPKRHVGNFFELSERELEDVMRLLRLAKERLTEGFHPDGFNVGVNIGDAAGQTIGHVHVHLIPRYSGDVEDPTGGVRGVIPRKQKY